MFKRFFTIVICFICLFSTSIVVFADSSSPQNTIAENKMKLQQLDSKFKEIDTQMSDLKIQMSKLNNIINKNNEDINKNENNIKDQESKIEQLKKVLDSEQNITDKRIRAMYINGCDKKYAVLLLESKNILDFAHKLNYIVKIVSYDRKALNDLNDKKKIIDKNINSLNLQKNQLQQQKSDYESNLQLLNKKKIDLDSLSIQFNQERQNSLSIIEDNENKLIAHSISIIDSQSPTADSLKDAIHSLQGLLAQLSTDSVKTKAQSYIDSGKQKLASVQAIATTNSGTTINSRGSAGTSYKAVYKMTATAYSGDSSTASGLKPVRDSNGLSTIAVDPSVIPLGTKVFIPGYGIAICSDTGSAIKGNIIDLYMNNNQECENWGRRTVTLYIIAYKGEW